MIFYRVIKRTNPRSYHKNTGAIYLPAELIGEKLAILTLSELTNLNKSYWFLRDLQRRINSLKMLKRGKKCDTLS